MHGPDFSQVKSVKQAEDLVRRGEVERLLLLPQEFGGKDVPENVVYVPAAIRLLKEQIDRDVIRPLIAERKITRYRALPEYQGDSFIPIAIKLEAWDPGAFTNAINIWGEALNRVVIPPKAG
jgi:hypothetical protein